MMTSAPGKTVADPRVVYILGSGHCGSTLLHLLMNAHPELCGTGELTFLTKMKKRAMEEGPDVKELEAVRSEFWQSVFERFQAESDVALEELSLREFINSPMADYIRGSGRYPAWRAMHLALFRALGEVSGREWVIDSSKTAGRCLQLHGVLGDRMRVIHLVRDRRGVFSSYLKKYGVGYGLRSSILVPIYCYLAQTILRKVTLRVRYEDLVRNPEATLRTICRFLGIDYSAQMLDFRSVPDYSVNGNRMRFSSSSEIVLDEKWRRTLSKRNKAIFTVFGGWLNWLEGYTS
ncbi:MAG: sulfotransferase [Alphaproteobacteria bacterium]